MQEEQFVQIRKHIDPFYEVVEDRGVWFALLSSECFFWFRCLMISLWWRSKTGEVMNILNTKLNHFILLGGSLQCWRLCAVLTGWEHGCWDPRSRGMDTTWGGAVVDRWRGWDWGMVKSNANLGRESHQPTNQLWICDKDKLITHFHPSLWSLRIRRMELNRKNGQWFHGELVVHIVRDTQWSSQKGGIENECDLVMFGSFTPRLEEIFNGRKTISSSGKSHWHSLNHLTKCKHKICPKSGDTLNPAELWLRRAYCSRHPTVAKTWWIVYPDLAPISNG